MPVASLKTKRPDLEFTDVGKWHMQSRENVTNILCSGFRLTEETVVFVELQHELPRICYFFLPRAFGH